MQCIVNAPEGKNMKNALCRNIRKVVRKKIFHKNAKLQAASTVEIVSSLGRTNDEKFSFRKIKTEKVT